MTLIDMLRPEQRRQLRQSALPHLQPRVHAPHPRATQAAVRRRRPADRGGHLRAPGACGYQRCIHCTRRRWWLLKHAFTAPRSPSTPCSRNTRARTMRSTALLAAPPSSTSCPTSAIPASAGEPRSTRGPAGRLRSPAAGPPGDRKPSRCVYPKGGQEGIRNRPVGRVKQGRNAFSAREPISRCRPFRQPDSASCTRGHRRAGARLDSLTGSIIARQKTDSADRGNPARHAPIRRLGSRRRDSG